MAFRLFAGRIEQANVPFYDGAGRPFLGPSAQEPGDPSHQGKSQGQETRASQSQRAHGGARGSVTEPRYRDAVVLLVDVLAVHARQIGHADQLAERYLLPRVYLVGSSEERPGALHIAARQAIAGSQQAERRSR